jgi:hypothetical protein
MDRKPSRPGKSKARRAGRPRGGALAGRVDPKHLRHKHLKIDQRKLDSVKRHFGVATEQEAIDLALEGYAADHEIVRVMRSLRGRIHIGDSLPKQDVNPR